MLLNNETIIMNKMFTLLKYYYTLQLFYFSIKVNLKTNHFLID